MKNTKIFEMAFASHEDLKRQIEKEISCKIFFDEAPRLNPKVSEIRGVICGYRVEDIEDPLMQKIRYLDKLIDELAK